MSELLRKLVDRTEAGKLKWSGESAGTVFAIVGGVRLSLVSSYPLLSTPASATLALRVQSQEDNIVTDIQADQAELHGLWAAATKGVVERLCEELDKL